MICHRCFNVDENDSNFVFVRCNIFKNVSKTCENCFFKHKTLKCSFNKSVFIQLVFDFQLIF